MFFNLHFLFSFFPFSKHFSLIQSYLFVCLYFCLPFLMRHIQKVSLRSASGNVLPMFSSRNFMALFCTYCSLTHLEFVFIWCERVANLILLNVAVQFSNTIYCISFSHCHFLPPLTQINCQSKYVFIYGLSILFH